MNMEEIESEIERNRKQRLEFVSRYAKWVKCTQNSVWSRQQRLLIESIIACANKVAKEGIKVR